MIVVLSRLVTAVGWFLVFILGISLFLVHHGNSDPSKEEAGGAKVITEEEEKYLILLARFAIEQYLDSGEVTEINTKYLSERLTEKRPTFVTLTTKGMGLRGCIGSLMPERPLYLDVIYNAISAATRDPRFPAVRKNELRDIRIEITINTRPTDMPFGSYSELLEKLVPHRDGVILITQYGRSTYLPQVWDQLPDKVEFLSYLSRKHGAPSDEWMKPGTRVETYHALAIIHQTDLPYRIIAKRGAVVGRRGAILLGCITPTAQHTFYGGYFVTEGTVLAPGCIIGIESDIK